MTRKILICATLLLLGLTFLPMHSFADDTSSTTTLSDAQLQEEDPLYGRANGYVDSGFYSSDDDSYTLKTALYGSSQTTSPYNNNTTYTHNSKFDGMAVHTGIDVSQWQKTIDWTQVKQSGIEFALIRVGSRSSDTGSMIADSTYQANIQNALAAGLKVGVYVFSQAITTDEAVDEANYICNLVSGYDITLPVIMDYEYKNGSSGLTGRLYNANLSVDTATAIVNAFASRVSEYGYTPMIYANKNMLSTKLNASKITSYVWVAHYTLSTSYAGDYKAWQYSDKGSVAGISGNVDTDFWYGDFPTVVQTGSTNQMYRMYNQNSGEHFYTSSIKERTNLVSQGWKFEGIAWKAPATSNTPVYRLYNPNAGDHFYTLSATERDNLVSLGWSYEGIGWYSDDNKQVTIFREYNPNAKVGTHNYTPSSEEHGKLTTSGWNDEGIAWYGVN